MFETPNKRQDEVLDTYTKYEPLLLEYVDRIAERRAEVERHVEPEDKEMIEAYKKAAEQENGYENYETHLKARVFEGILAKHGRDIFGKNAEVVPASEFDDWVNGTDAVLEGRDEKGKVIHIAIDAALSKDTRNIEKKNAAILNDLEQLDVPRKKEPFSLKYFTSPSGDGKPEKLSSVPRVVLGIYSEDFEEVLGDVRGGKKGMLELRRIFLTMIKNQLENQFIVALGLNGEKIDSREPGGKKLSPEFTKDTKNLYPLSENVVKHGWKEEEVEKLFSSFKKNWGFFSMKQFSLPEYRGLLQNTADAWEWTRKELLDAEAEKILSEDQADWEHNEVVEKLEEHLDGDRALKHRPFLAA